MSEQTKIRPFIYLIRDALDQDDGWGQHVNYLTKLINGIDVFVDCDLPWCKDAICTSVLIIDGVGIFLTDLEKDKLIPAICNHIIRKNGRDRQKERVREDAMIARLEAAFGATKADQ